jgi:hypothetical protein
MIERPSRINIFWVAALVVTIGIATSWEPFYESGASAQEQAYSHENLTGTWSGRMMNIPHSAKGIDVTITFTPDQAAVTKGIASFHNLDTNNRATGTIAKVDIRKDIVKFPLVYQGGAPGVDGTTASPQSPHAIRSAEPTVTTTSSVSYGLSFSHAGERSPGR